MMDEDRATRLTHPEFLDVGEGDGARAIAFRARPGRSPCVVWLGGFRSEMTATKAEALDEWAKANGQAFLRFDYSGHGRSAGRFEDGTISRWREETLAVVEAFGGGHPILVGSSMGGWLALLAAAALAEAGTPVAGLVLVAPAVDFTQALLWPSIGDEGRRAIEAEGVYRRPSAYSPEPVPITRALIEDGRTHLMLGGTIRAHAPVHILQGMADPDVPWRHAMALVEHLAGDPVTLTLVKDGDHRLSRPEDVGRLLAAVASMVEAAAPSAADGVRRDVRPTKA